MAAVAAALWNNKNQGEIASVREPNETVAHVQQALQCMGERTETPLKLRVAHETTFSSTTGNYRSDCSLPLENLL